MTARIASVVVSVWILAAPGVYGYDGRLATVHHLVAPVAAAASIVALGPVTRSLRWVAAGVAVILVATPPGHVGGGAMLDHLLTAIALLTVSLVPSAPRHRYGGGWRCVRPSRTTSTSTMP